MTAVNAPTGTRPVDPSAGAAQPGPAPTRSTGLRAVWRSWRGPLLAAVVVVLAAVAGLALAGPTGGEPLDPRDAGPTGARALARVLGDHGVDVRIRDRFDDVSRDLSAGAATVLVARPEQLAPSRADDLRRAVERSASHLVLVGAQSDLLDRLGIPVDVLAPAEVDVRDAECDDLTPRRAGSALTGGPAYQPAQDGGAGTRARPGNADQPVDQQTACYPADDGAGYLALQHPGGRTTTLLGAGAPLSNDRLADAGDAALAVGLLGRTPRLVWWTPSVTDGGTSPVRVSALDLVPDGVRFAAVQLLVVLAVVVAWRGRRMGRLVTEPLPVVVRAVETTRGRARLYRRARARGRAARVLRAATTRRIALRCGLPRTADPGDVAALVASRTGRATADVQALLAGPEPADDAALVALARQLDALETEVRSP